MKIGDAMVGFALRRPKTVAGLIVALVAVITTMSLLVIFGKTVHIMSSMIPIFIMPIAVLDAVHILSDRVEIEEIVLKTRKKAAG
jgi:uncharacterized protein